MINCAPAAFAMSIACSGVQCDRIQGLYAAIDMIARSMRPRSRSLAKLCQCRVASEQNAPAVSFQNVTVVPAVSVPLLSRAPMFYGKGKDVDLACRSFDRLLLVPVKLGYVAQSRPP